MVNGATSVSPITGLQLFGHYEVDAFVVGILLTFDPIHADS
jgi:hypothetical protein